MTQLPKGHEHVTGGIRDTEFLSWPISGTAANEGSTMTEQDNKAKLLDALTALAEGGEDWVDLLREMKAHFSEAGGDAALSVCGRCGLTDDLLVCVDCHQEDDHDCMYRDMDPECKVCHKDVTHPLCEDHLDADVYTDLGLNNKATGRWCSACRASHPQGVCPHSWYDSMNANRRRV